MSREIDVLIAEFVTHKKPLGYLGYSTDIKESMLVVEQLRQHVKYNGTYRDGFRMHWDGKWWSIGFTDSSNADCMASHFEYDYKVSAYYPDPTYGPCMDESLPMAICLYALKVYGIPLPSPGAPRASNLKASPGDTGS